MKDKPLIGVVAHPVQGDLKDLDPSVNSHLPAIGQKYSLANALEAGAETVDLLLPENDQPLTTDLAEALKTWSTTHGITFTSGTVTHPDDRYGSRREVRRYTGFLSNPKGRTEFYRARAAFCQMVGISQFASHMGYWASGLPDADDRIAALVSLGNGLKEYGITEIDFESGDVTPNNLTTMLDRVNDDLAEIVAWICNDWANNIAYGTARSIPSILKAYEKGKKQRTRKHHFKGCEQPEDMSLDAANWAPLCGLLATKNVAKAEEHTQAAAEIAPGVAWLVEADVHIGGMTLEDVKAAVAHLKTKREALFKS